MELEVLEEVKQETEVTWSLRERFSGDSSFYIIVVSPSYDVFTLLEENSGVCLTWYDCGEEYLNSKEVDKSVLSAVNISSIDECIILYQQYKKHQSAANDALDTFSSSRIDPLIVTELNKSKYADLLKLSDSIAEITKKAHGDNCRFDINLAQNKLDVYLLYPEVIISNGNPSSERLLKDIVVKIPFIVSNNNAGEKIFILSDLIKGTRLSWGSTEANVGYRHSHLPREVDTFKFNSFCLGSTEIAAMNMDLRLHNKFTPLKYELFIHMIQNYLKHESLAGGPYIKLSDIKRRGGYYSAPSRVRIYVRNASYGPSDFNVVYVKNSNKFEVTIDKTLEASVLKKIQEAGYAEVDYLVNVDNDGSEYLITSHNALNVTRSTNKSAEVLKVAKMFNKEPHLYDDNTISETTYQISKSLLRDAKLHLESKINEYYNKEYATS